MNLSDTELLTLAVVDLFAQGRFGTTEGGSCTYLSGDPKGDAAGCSCIAGLALRRLGMPLADLWKVTGAASNLDGSTAWEYVKDRDLNLWYCMQVVHDRAARARQIEPRLSMKEAIAITLFDMHAKLGAEAASIYHEGWKRFQQGG